MDATQIKGSLETFSVKGKAAHVLAANAKAWSALEACLGVDPVAAWSLKVMQHAYDPTANPGVEFLAEFVRDPDYDPDAS